MTTTQASTCASAGSATLQGVNSPTFHAPPLDRGLSVPDLYEYNAKHSPNHPVFCYANPETGVVRDITYSEAWGYICTTAQIVRTRYADTKEHSAGARPVIAILALSDSLTYALLNMAIMTLGYVAFPLSPRNSAVVTAHLLEVTNASMVFASEDVSMQALATEAIKILGEKGVRVRPSPMVKLDDVKELNAGRGHAVAVTEIADDDVTFILHSSGTTSLPKPIKITKKGLVNLAKIPCYGEVDLAGKRIAAHTNPLFHAMGLGTQIRQLVSGCIFALYEPTVPPTLPTPDNFYAAWTACNCDIVFCIPVFIEAWARDPAKISALSALDCIVYSGAPVNHVLGNALLSQGVVMHPFWGSTEIGPATMFIPRDPPSVDEWEYFVLSNHINLHMRPADNLQNVFEPILVPTDLCFPHCKTNTVVDGKPAYSVGDYLERHPIDARRWKVYGRKDDQIILSTAENINPVPVENIILTNKSVGGVVMFGRSHMEPGILVEPASGAADRSAEDFITLIWPTIEVANTSSAKYAWIRRERIVVCTADKPLVRTPKKTARRPACLELYADEIEATYADERDAEAAGNREFPDRV
ncbi:acetyl-CoA synthetase-like protein [Peniophora sp. CONT]|nr:acetyl-CoA synthetase-like protein [Peniophora sp. CONT]